MIWKAILWISAIAALGYLYVANGANVQTGGTDWFVSDISNDIPRAQTSPDHISSQGISKTANQKSVERVGFMGNQQHACPALNNKTTIRHYGQSIRLNGANIAWSTNQHYGRDVGEQTVQIAAFREHFRNIAASGGNSARWWLHTRGHVTPVVTPDGRVTRLSNDISNDMVVGQLRTILDAAWAEGVLVTIVLFNFDMMCNGGNPVAYSKMLQNHHMTYINNALDPMVRGLKDHPALLAWEIFNEAEGMTQGTYFFGDPNLENCATGIAQPKWVLQRFVNHASARIKSIDRNVKVTTSLGNPEHIGDYSNAVLTRQPWSNPRGHLDFYQIHWYSGDGSPYKKTAASYRLDRPIIIGEFAYKDNSETRTPAAMLARKILQNGYAGAWSWSQSTESTARINLMMQNGARCSTPVNKQAVEMCVTSKNPSCYAR